LCGADIPFDFAQGRFVRRLDFALPLDFVSYITPHRPEQPKTQKQDQLQERRTGVSAPHGQVADIPANH
jgi:hypothetical protein